MPDRFRVDRLSARSYGGETQAHDTLPYTTKNGISVFSTHAIPRFRSSHGSIEQEIQAQAMAHQIANCAADEAALAGSFDRALAQVSTDVGRRPKSAFSCLSKCG